MRIHPIAAIALLAILAAPEGLPAFPLDIIESAKRGDENAARKLLDQDPGLATARDEHDFTPLHWAGIRGHWHIFRELLEAGAPVNAVGGDGGSPLHWA